MEQFQRSLSLGLARGTLKGVIAVDGKDRRSFQYRHQQTIIHMISAWALRAETGFGAAQDHKSNEIGNP
jgi:hypothetical protein